MSGPYFPRSPLLQLGPGFSRPSIGEMLSRLESTLSIARAANKLEREIIEASQTPIDYTKVIRSLLPSKKEQEWEMAKYKLPWWAR